MSFLRDAHYVIIILALLHILMDTVLYFAGDVQEA